MYNIFARKESDMGEKIIVVGGGIGGLTAGALLANNGYDITVLEASNEWVVTDQTGQQWQGTHVIFNVPIHSLKKILEPTLFQQLPIRYKKKANLPTWGAFTMYFALKEDNYFEQLPLFQ